MRWKLGTVVALVIASCLLPSAVFGERGLVKAGEYLVGYRGDNTRSFHSVIQGERALRPRRYNRRYNLCRKIVAGDPRVSWCTPNFRVQAQAQDPYVFSCADPKLCSWAVDNPIDTDLDLPQAWNITEGVPDIVVAVLDTGLDLNHPDIALSLWSNPGEIPSNNIDDDGNGYIDDLHGINTIGGGPPLDDNGHGTHVAGIIAAARGNGIGIAGTAPAVKILPIKILGKDGGGEVSNAIEAIDYLIALRQSAGINIVVANNSWGGFIPAAQVGPLEDAFRRAGDAGILMTAAAGNGGSDRIGDDLDLTLDPSLGLSPFYPASFSLPNTIAVAATSISGHLAGFSNFGASTVHLAAPGEQIRSLLAAGVNFGQLRENGTCLASGTSMATPHVSGVIALISSAFPALNALQIRERLLMRTYQLPIEDSSLTITGGRANAFYAVTTGDIPIPTPVPTFTPTVTPLPRDTATPLPTQIPNVLPTQLGLETPASPTPEVSVNTATITVQIAPIKKFAQNILKGIYFIDAGQRNLVHIDSGVASPIGLSVKLSSGACELVKRPLTLRRSYYSLVLRGSARLIKNLSLQVIDTDASVRFAKQYSVRNRSRSKGSRKCKALRRAIDFVESR